VGRSLGGGEPSFGGDSVIAFSALRFPEKLGLKTGKTWEEQREFRFGGGRGRNRAWSLEKSGSSENLCGVRQLLFRFEKQPAHCALQC